MTTTSPRQLMERRIAKLVAEDLIAAGLQVTVFDGEEEVLERSVDVTAILAAMFSTDEDYLFAYLPTEKARLGWVRFVYGNDGFDVVNDYTVNLEAILTKSMAEVERLEAQA